MIYMETYTIDATNKRLGRIATEAALVLMGKNTPSYRPYRAPAVIVTVKNAAKLDFRQRKLKQKIYTSYSGYPGGLKSETADRRAARHGYGALIRAAVKGMLPKNKLQHTMMSRLIVSEA